MNITKIDKKQEKETAYKMDISQGTTVSKQIK